MIFTYQNESAKGPLVLQVTLDCNTSDEVILSNVMENSRRPNVWIDQTEAHDGIAVVCGSGPSLADCLSEIESLRARGAKVFALNNAANFIEADYQVLLDARPGTIAMVGPAGDHLVASQCDPSVFDALPNAILWHATHGNLMVDEQEGFPREGGYCLIGGGVTVGNTSLPLIYAMGYREFHIFGMDSCHRKTEGHVLPQPLNDDDPLTYVNFQGKEYVCSFTMKEQAEVFAARAKALEDGGCTFKLYGDGYLQDRWKNRKEYSSEREKYEDMYRYGYGLTSPGQRVAQLFVEIVAPRAGDRIVDYGCGSGLGTLELHKLTKCEIAQVDFADNCRVEEARDFRFIRADLTEPIPILSDYGFCADVMEHIEPEKVEAAIKNIMDSARRCFFQISTVDDVCGDVIGHPLHLTVKSHDWWREKFISLGYSVEWEKKERIAALFYVTLTT